MLIMFIVVWGCMKEKSNSTNELTSTESSATLDVDALLYEEYGDLRDVYNYEPFYSKQDWMNDRGELLYPYEKNKDNLRGIENTLASLYMPEDVLKKASSEELLKVVCDGWLSTYATSAILFNLPSEYVANSTARNQAANELIKRADMIDVIIEDYINKCYVKGNTYSEEAMFILNQIQFEEIVLGSNHAYLQMDNNVREKVLDAILEKVSCIESKEYYTGDLVSGFFTYIIEEETNGGSYWYTYICENRYELAEKYLDVESGAFWVREE